LGGERRAELKFTVYWRVTVNNKKPVIGFRRPKWFANLEEVVLFLHLYWNSGGDSGVDKQTLLVGERRGK
jgi:hypothetical protein